MASAALDRSGRPVRRPAPRRASRVGALAQILPLVILFYSTMLPLEVRLEVADQTLYPYRLAIIGLLPWFVNRVATGALRLRMADAWIFLGGAWVLVSFINAYGYLDGLLRGGAIVFDTVAPYLVARICIRQPDDLRRLLIMVAPGAAAAGLTMMLEAITHQPFVRPLAADIFGDLASYENGEAVGRANEFRDVRLGLLRAAGPFSHPILAGVFLSSLLGMYFSSGIRGWPRLTGLFASTMMFFSVSSGAFLGLLMIGALVAYDWLQRRFVSLSWKMLLIAAGVIAALLQLLTAGGVVSLVIRMSLNPQTGYYRRLIWQFGTDTVAQNPWFGIAYTNYDRLRWMNTSVDNYWLVLAIRHGMIVPVSFGIVVIAAIISLSVASVRQSERDRQLYVAVAVTVFTLGILGFTVSFFGGMQIWFMMCLGLAMSLGGRLGEPASPVPVPQAGRRAGR